MGTKVISMYSPSGGMNGWPPLSSWPLVRSRPSPHPVIKMQSPKTVSVRARRMVWPSGLVVGERGDLAVRLRTQPAPVHFGYRFLDHVDAAVAEGDVHPAARVQASGHRRGHEAAGGSAAHPDRCGLRTAVQVPIL